MDHVSDVTGRMADDPATPPVLRRALREADPYWYWRAKLAGEDPDPPADRTELPAGFWRLRSGDPMAVWLDAEGKRVALRGFKSAERVMAVKHMEAMAETGSFGQAVSEDLYRAAIEAGEWPDDPPAVAPIGHNLPESEYERLRTEIEGEVETTAPFLKRPIETQEDADKCSTWARRVGLLAKRADEAREEEKAPHLAAGREVDDRWRPVIADAKELTSRLKKHVEPFLIRKKREAEEVARRAAEEAERLRREAAEANQRSEAERADLIQQAQDAERRAEPAKAIAGRPNMRVSLRKKVRARIVDYDACHAALKDHRDMRELVDQLANRAVKAGVPLAGVEAEEYEEAA